MVFGPVGVLTLSRWLFRVLTSIAKGKKTLTLPRLAGHADRQADDMWPMWLPGPVRRCYGCLQVGAARRGVCPAEAACTFYGCGGRMVNYNEDAGRLFRVFYKGFLCLILHWRLQLELSWFDHFSRRRKKHSGDEWDHGWRCCDIEERNYDESGVDARQWIHV